MRYREINRGSKKALQQKGIRNRESDDAFLTDKTTAMGTPDIELLKGQLEAEETVDRPTRRRTVPSKMTR